MGGCLGLSEDTMTLSDHPWRVFLFFGAVKKTLRALRNLGRLSFAHSRSFVKREIIKYTTVCYWQIHHDVVQPSFESLPLLWSPLPTWIAIKAQRTVRNLGRQTFVHSGSFGTREIVNYTIVYFWQIQRSTIRPWTLTLIRSTRSQTVKIATRLVAFLLWDYQDTGTGRDSEQVDDIITSLDFPDGSY